MLGVYSPFSVGSTETWYLLKPHRPRGSLASRASGPWVLRLLIPQVSFLKILLFPWPSLSICWCSVKCKHWFHLVWSALTTQWWPVGHPLRLICQGLKCGLEFFPNNVHSLNNFVGVSALATGPTLSSLPLPCATWAYPPLESCLGTWLVPGSPGVLLNTEAKTVWSFWCLLLGIQSLLTNLQIPDLSQLVCRLWRLFHLEVGILTVPLLVRHGRDFVTFICKMGIKIVPVFQGF